MDNLTVKSLRDRKPLKMHDRSTQLFTHIQINKNAEFICWQRFVSLDKRKWTELNSYLTLKEVLSIRAIIIKNNLTY